VKRVYQDTELYFHNPWELLNTLGKSPSCWHLIWESYRTVLGNNSCTRIDQSEIAKQCGAIELRCT
jgi:hypothetical protein